MKKVLFLFAILLIACNSKEKSAVSNEKPSAPFDWLLGNWIRTNEKKDRQTFENWIKINNSEYAGEGYTLQNTDTIWKETVQLIESKGRWKFSVTPKGESKPTVFELIKMEDTTFTCESKTNDFPKIIHYFKDGHSLKAEISGGDMKIPFEFERFKTK